VSRVSDIIDESGIGSLTELSPTEEIGEVLRHFRDHVKGLDPLDRELAVIEAKSSLKANGVEGGARLIDIALRGLGKSESQNLQGSEIKFTDIKPWPDDVMGDALLTEITASIKKHVIVHDEAAVAIALWILHTYTFDTAHISPRLAIISPTKRCGKTTLLKLLHRLVKKPMQTSNLTPAVLFRLIEKEHPTLLVDEADTYLVSNDDFKSVLNAGHDRQFAFVCRCVGEDYEPRKFYVWSPVAIAAIGRIQDTLMDRSVVIEMKRKTNREKVSALRRTQAKKLESVARKCLRWANDNIDRLRYIEPDLPSELNDRSADNWEPLLAIAECVVGQWPKAARNAALRLSAKTAQNDDSETYSIQLLRDIWQLLSVRLDSDIVTMKEIVEQLVDLEDRPWANLGRGKQLTTSYLGKLLRRFDIHSKVVRSGVDVAKGYRREWFSDAFDRYLPKESVTSVTAPESLEKMPLDDGLQNPSVTEPEWLQNTNDFEDVTDVTEKDGVLNEAYEERAAIMEFCGGLPRAEAERLARIQTVDSGRNEDIR
jgi:putative DNA primase/helicase